MRITKANMELLIVGLTVMGFTLALAEAAILWFGK